MQTVLKNSGEAAVLFTTSTFPIIPTTVPQPLGCDLHTGEWEITTVLELLRTSGNFTITTCDPPPACSDQEAWQVSLKVW